ncbi:MAG TPA: flagellar FlbD family protein [Actinomycetota bacterium]
MGRDGPDRGQAAQRVAPHVATALARVALSFAPRLPTEADAGVGSGRARGADADDRVTRLHGSSMAVNCDLIERVESTPQTVLTLVDGSRFVVRAFRASVVRLATGWSATRHPSPPCGWCPTPTRALTTATRPSGGAVAEPTPRPGAGSCRGCGAGTPPGPSADGRRGRPRRR